MTITEITQQVVETKSAHLLRYRANSCKETGTAQYDCKPIFTGSKRGWIMLDLFTASAIQAGYNACTPANQAKFNNIPLGKLASICMGSVK